MLTQGRASRSKAQTEIAPLIHLWLLRLLVPLGGHQEFVGHQGFNCDNLAITIGLGKWVDASSTEFELRPVMADLRKLHQSSERKYRNSSAPDCLKKNVARLSTLVGLSETDGRILEFAVLLHTDRLLDDTADRLGRLPSVKVAHVLSVLLDISEQDIRAALGAQGVLTRSGLVSVDRSATSTLRGKLDLLSDTFADKISSHDADPVTLLRDTVTLSTPAHLSIHDYAHINTSLDVLRPYLQNSIETGRQGVNLLIHGAPGTGKSQLAKALAKELGCELFEVASEDNDGDPVSGARRLRAYRAAQNFFVKRRAIILFDEVEDVFNDGDRLFGKKSTAQTRKAWVNRILEENQVPTLWLANAIDAMDPAFIRRYDMIVELPVPPKSQRKRILLDACSDLLDPASVTRIVESDDLAPAVVTRAASVVRSIRDRLDAAGVVSALELLIGNTLQAQGHKPIRKLGQDTWPETYDPQFIEADSDLSLVAQGLKASKSGRLCLFGPPGTGKSAYGRWLAEQMGVPLIVKRASDLMSKWVGENEKNIARAFRQAEQEGALLMIDEVDSFLQDRRGARSSWEVTQVNEMLTQMESFSGVFIASTNHMGGLDPAALRRFDLKVKFGYLRPDQSAALLGRYCSALSLSAPEPQGLLRLHALQNLTPGDFAAVARQSRFKVTNTANQWVDALEAECSLKEGASSAIGFLA